MEAYKTDYLKPDKIAMIPYCGYEPMRKRSHIANNWLNYIEIKYNIILEREVRIGNYFADGYYRQTNTVYEFLGCFFHGCRKCYINDIYAYNQFLKDTIANISIKTQQKLETYRSIGVNIVSIWECEFKQQLKCDKEMKLFIDNSLITFNTK